MGAELIPDAVELIVTFSPTLTALSLMVTIPTLMFGLPLPSIVIEDSPTVSTPVIRASPLTRSTVPPVPTLELPIVVIPSNVELP